jgi:hypothetical protein
MQQDSLSAEIILPTSFIPDLLASINGFDRHPTLLTFTLTLSQDSFTNPARICNARNPIYGVFFPGRSLFQTQQPLSSRQITARNLDIAHNFM